VELPSVLARIADRIVIMNRGAIIGELSPHGDDLEHAFFEQIHEDDIRRGL
jgi:ABC-2 type transport system ATP-binding protein